MHRIHPFFSILAVLTAGAITASAQPAGGRSGGGQMATGSVSGTVIDSTSGEGLGAATVALRNAQDSALVTGAITGRDGSFSITGVRPGRYYARISFVGYQTRIIDNIRVTPRAPEINLGKVAVLLDASLQNEVVVSARRDFMTTAIDRTIYKTEDLLVSSGGSATDVLRNIPSVEVDIDGKVSLRGNQNVAVQINGRPVMMTGDALANFLQTLPADALDRIEVIANPSAKFDPEGMAGILNIELKEGQDRGLSGSVNAGAGTQNNYNLGANISYGSGPWNIFANYGFRTGDRESNGYRFQENRLAEPYSSVMSRDTGVRGSFGHSFNTSIDYAFNKEHSLSYTTFFSTRDGDDNDSTLYTDMDGTRLPVDLYRRTSAEENSDFNMDHRLSYKWVGEPRKHELTAELRYGYESEEESSNFTRQDLALDGNSGVATPELQRNRLDEKTGDYGLQVDYTRPLWEGGHLETGYKGTLRSLDNDFFSETFDSTSGEFMPDNHLNNTFTFDEQIHAVYGMIGQELGDFGMQVGVRAEQAMTTFDLATTGESYDNSYFSLFPSAFLTYQAAEGTQLKMSYSKRINRPGTWALNPFTSSNDPLFRRIGNPYLKPEYTHAIEFTATQFLPFGTIALTPYFRRTVDAIEHYQRFDSNGVTTTTFENFGQVDSYGAELIGTARVGDWLTATGNVSLYKSVTDASNVDNDYTNNAIGWTARLNTTFNLGWGTDLQASVFYMAPREIGGGEMRGMLRSDLAVQKKLLDDRLKLGLRVNDPFNQSGFSAWRETDTYYSEFERRRSGRTAMLTLSYAFGSQDSKQKRRDQRGGDQGGGDVEDMGW